MNQSEYLSNIGTFVTVLTVCWLGFFVIGKGALTALRMDEDSDHLAAGVGMAVVSLAGGFCAGVGFGARTWSLVTLLVAVGILIFRHRSWGGIVPTPSSGIHYLFAIILVAFYFSPAVHRFGINLFTLGNQDIMGYTLDVKHLLARGFPQDGQIQNYFAGPRSQVDWSGTKLIAAFGTSITGGNILFSAMPIIGAVVVQTIVAASGCVARATESKLLRVAAPLTVSFAIIFPLGAHVVGNYLLAQVVTICLATTLISVLSLGMMRLHGPLIGVLIIALIVSWGVTIAPVVVVIGFVVVVTAVIRLRAKRPLRPTSEATSSIWFPFLIGGGSLVWSVWLGLWFAGVQAGWTLPTGSVLDLLGFTSDVFAKSPRTEHLIGLVAGSVVLGFTLSMVVKHRSDTRTRLFSIQLASIAILVGGWKSYGSTSYSFWKLESLLWPLIVIISIRLLIEVVQRTRVSALIGVILCALSINALVSSSRLWSTSDYTLAVSSPVLALRNDALVATFPEVQVDIGGGWNEMAAMLLLRNKVIRSNGETFFPRLPINEWPRIVQPDYQPVAGEKVTPLASGFLLVENSAIVRP